MFSWASQTYEKAKHSVERVVKGFSYHPGFVKMKQLFKNLIKFCFTLESVETAKTITNELPKSKSMSGDISLNFLTSSEFT